MRAFALSLIALLSAVDLAWSQGAATPSGQASSTPSAEAFAQPTFRPVLIGQGPSALINRMDEQDLVRKGQKDALVMFVCMVKKDGGVERHVSRHAGFGFSQTGIAEKNLAGIQSEVYPRHL